MPSRGKVESITGRMAEPSRARIISSCSWRDPTVTPFTATFLDMIRAVGTSPAKPASTPIRETWPPIRVAVTDWARVPAPPISTTTSTPRPPVRAAAAAPHSGVWR